MTPAAARWRGRLARVAWHGGGLAAWHRLRNRETLTVAMFHRVLHRRDPRWQTANPAWTISAGVFEACLDFFAAHYNVVDLPSTLDAMERERPLPERGLLIAFDDGWSDTESCALPALERFQMPAVVFVAAGAIDGDECWQEPVLRAWSEARIGPPECAAAWELGLGRPCAPNFDAHDFVLQLAALSARERQAVLGRLGAVLSRPEPRAMLTRDQIARLAASRVAIESHGLTHHPMGRLANPRLELAESRRRLERISGRRVSSLSFPHGSYNDVVLRAAREEGFRLLFSSDAVLNPCPGGRVAGRLLGRIPMFESEIVGPSGRLDASRLARWLFLRPRAALTGGLVVD
jgi:peptidoglycan/xylan/chitin deacetylase (PgdA/CDA1 family)